MYFYSSNFCSTDYQAYLGMIEQMKSLKQKNFELQKALNECENKISILNRQNELLRSKQAEPKVYRLKQEQQSSPEQIMIRKKNRKRKRNDNIDNIFDCPYNSCTKAYGTSLALNLHIKLKHNGGSKKQRQRLAKIIIEAQKKGQEVPRFSIDFPPNYIQNYKRLLATKKNF